MPAKPDHYSLIASAIAQIDASDTPPSLEDLAAAAGLSPQHFQRVFSGHVGVSPARYAQYLRLDHAKTLLRDRFTILDASFEAGLSGPSRLHDLLLRWEAMTPGEYALGGAGLLIRYGWVTSPFGPALIMGTDRGVCGLGFAPVAGDRASFDDLAQRWPKAQFEEDNAQAQLWADAAFGEAGNLQLHLMGKPFQIKVWEALLSIPPGQVTTYSEIAKAVGNAKAVRAVGTAVGRNPVSWLIPCHRALRKSGGLGGYHWGLPVKRAMLAYESAHTEPTKPDIAI